MCRGPKVLLYLADTNVIARWVNFMAYFYMLLIIILAAPQAHAVVYSNGINRSAWKTSASPTQCDIWQDIPHYGRAVFRTRAGEKSVFFLESTSSKFNAGAANIEARPPVWYNSEASDANKLGVVPIKRGRRPLWLASSWAELLADKLNTGKDVIVAQNRWFDTTNKLSEVEITPIGFAEQYKKYLMCLPELIQANFDQLRRTALLFKAGDVDKLSLRVQRTLDQILELAKHEKTVRTFYIDGHTDGLGPRVENLELSKKRAEMVAQYLTKRGIPQDWLKVRWHGERYPVASNATKRGQAKNRRVTIRLEKSDDAKAYDYASANPQERAASMSKSMQ